MSDKQFTAQQKLKAIERELRWRRYVYPRRVEKGDMKQQAADEQIALFEEIRNDYEKLADVELARAEEEAAKQRLL
jgi:hypothetical protein